MVRWGIIGLGKIAERFSASLSHSETGRLAAVASRQEEKRAAYLARYPGLTAYDSYDALFRDPDIDAVYIAVPHSMHKELCLQALRAKKAVLCEKPVSLSEREAREITACARENHIFFMEAMKTRFIPAIGEIKAALASGAIGEVKSLHAAFCSKLTDADLMTPGRYAGDPAEGGALLDAGPYPIAFALDLLGEGYEEQESRLTKWDNGLIAHAAIRLRYPGGALAELEAGFDRHDPRTAVITGTEGTMEIPIWNRPCEFRLISAAGTRVCRSELPVDDLFGEIEAANESIRKGVLEHPNYTWENMLAVMRVIDSAHGLSL